MAQLVVDPVFEKVHPLDTPLCRDVWSDKYQFGGESYEAMATRVSMAVYAKDPAGLKGGPANVMAASNAIRSGLWMPAGRILAGAGTPKRVTLLNCFVNSEVEDDMESIAKGLGNIMLTQQQGGGIGTDFSNLRPPGAILRRTGAVASGPGPFIDVWDAACATIRSAGDRRGAMMGTLGCWHPFLLDFIEGKHTKGRWTNFNVSVLITDAFMGAVQDDEEWYLHHPVPPAIPQDPELERLNFTDEEGDGKLQYVYAVHRARDLWDLIIRSTYDYAEPGVIFIDRVNDLNNLKYIEHLQCTNPCGEQPLPNHGCCDLGAVLISRCVKHPFTDDAYFDYDLLRDAAKIGIRFLDNVIDVTNYPLPEQQEEEFNKRRIGLGIAGLADAMHMLGMRYGSPRSCEFAEKVMKEVAIAAYWASNELAQEKGSFPLFDKEKFCDRPFIKQLPEDLQAAIRLHGIRNGVLLTIAPTGTTSIAFGNGSSGLEPVFAHSMRRKVRQNNADEWLEYDEVAYGARLYLALNPGKTLDDLPSYMNVCDEVKVYEHVRIQEVCQKWVDASISKTINVPKDISYEEFKDVYQLAYDSGCKGCTTYRPTPNRGSILSTGDSVEPEVGGDVLGTMVAPPERPEVLDSRTVKVKWQKLNSALYLTIGYVNGQPYEVFLNSKDQSALEWTMALTILMSMSLRTGTTLEAISTEFLQVQALEGSWADGRYWPSLIAYLGHKMKVLLGDTASSPALGGDSHDQKTSEGVSAGIGEAGRLMAENAKLLMRPMSQCPECKQFTATSLSGCLTCTDCGYSKCG